MIAHVNYQVPEDVVHTQALTDFMEMLGLYEVQPDEALDDQYVVRWWQDMDSDLLIHIVGRGMDPLPMGYGHLCLKVTDTRMALCTRSPWLIRHNPDSPLKRLWLYGPGGIRVEVQPRGF
jgi:hypothetical protein